MKYVIHIYLYIIIVIIVIIVIIIIIIIIIIVVMTDELSTVVIITVLFIIIIVIIIIYGDDGNYFCTDSSDNLQGSFPYFPPGKTCTRSQLRNSDNRVLGRNILQNRTYR